MRTFNIVIELTEEEIEFLKSVDWTEKNPQEPFSSKATKLYDLCEKGVVQELINTYDESRAKLLIDNSADGCFNRRSHYYASLARVHGFI
jgi:endogenous inhibitor of DNA gyrase (YacG/DUF329 family)